MMETRSARQAEIGHRPPTTLGPPLPPAQRTGEVEVDAPHRQRQREGATRLALAFAAMTRVDNGMLDAQRVTHGATLAATGRANGGNDGVALPSRVGTRLWMSTRHTRAQS